MPNIYIKRRFPITIKIPSNDIRKQGTENETFEFGIFLKQLNAIIYNIFIPRTKV